MWQSDCCLNGSARQTKANHTHYDTGTRDSHVLHELWIVFGTHLCQHRRMHHCMLTQQATLASDAWARSRSELRDHVSSGKSWRRTSKPPCATACTQGPALVTTAKIRGTPRGDGGACGAYWAAAAAPGLQLLAVREHPLDQVVDLVRLPGRLAHLPQQRPRACARPSCRDPSDYCARPDPAASTRKYLRLHHIYALCIGIPLNLVTMTLLKCTPGPHDHLIVGL